MGNPYQGQVPYEAAWAQGYEYGQANPGDTGPVSPDFSSWGYDEETTSNIARVWQEGALAGREEGGRGGRDLPFYDQQSDTLYVDAEEFPALVMLSQSGDVDSWLREVGVDPDTLTDDEHNV